MTYVEMLQALLEGKRVKRPEGGPMLEMQKATVPIFIEYDNSNCNTWHQTRFVLVAENIAGVCIKGAPWSFTPAEVSATDWEVVL